MESLDLFDGFYHNKKILITGHTGFKGSWLAIWLKELGAKVIGLSLDPKSTKDNYVLSRIGEKIIDLRGDIRDSSLVSEIFYQYQPEMVFHLAAQPLVRYSYEQPIETYQTNVMGTIHILEAMRYCKSTRVGVLITTDKCYENREQIWGYRENDAMGGHDPYSSSKACAEIAIASWRKSFINSNNPNGDKKAIASVRAGNVIGGGDWAQDRIVPDCIRSLEKGKPILIRNPKAIRPWQYVLEPLRGYLELGKKLWENGREYSEAWNFGPSYESIVPVWNLAEKIIKYYGNGKLQDISDPSQPHEAKLLTLDISKAVFKLDWKPILNLEQTIQFTMEWYKRYANEDVYHLCKEEIGRYSELCKSSNKW